MESTELGAANKNKLNRNCSKIETNEESYCVSVLCTNLTRKDHCLPAAVLVMLCLYTIFTEMEKIECFRSIHNTVHADPFFSVKKLFVFNRLHKYMLFLCICVCMLLSIVHFIVILLFSTAKSYSVFSPCNK